jgi:four helix bundle protein
MDSPKPLSSYRELRVWQSAYELVLEVYRCTKDFPQDERFCLLPQMRRAAISIASNIAEGYGRSHRKEYLQFLGHARGSLFELETQALVCIGLGYPADTVLNLIEAVGRQLTALQRSLQPGVTPA